MTGNMKSIETPNQTPPPTQMPGHEAGVKTLHAVSDVLDTLKLPDLAEAVRKHAEEAARSERSASPERVQGAVDRLQSFVAQFTTPTALARENHLVADERQRDEAEKTALPMLRSLLGSSAYIPRHMLRELTQKFSECAASSPRLGSPRPTTIRPQAYPRYKAPGVPARAGYHAAKLTDQEEVLPPSPAHQSPAPTTDGGMRMPVVVTSLPKSETYVPRPPGVPRENDPFDPTDEYRDDDDPGYRIRDLWEADLIHELQIRERGGPEAAKIPFYAAFIRPTLPPEFFPGQQTSQVDPVAQPLSTSRKPRQSTPLPTVPNTRSTTYNSPNPQRAASISSSSSLSATRPSIPAGNGDDGAHSQRSVSPTFGCAPPGGDSLEVFDGQNHHGTAMAGGGAPIPSFGLDGPEDFHDVDSKQEASLSSGATDVGKQRSSPRSPEFGSEVHETEEEGEEKQRSASLNAPPVSDNLIGRRVEQAVAAGQDELAFCSVEDTLTVASEPDVTTPPPLPGSPVIATTTQKPLPIAAAPASSATASIAMSDPFRAIHQAGAAWRAAYSDGNFAAHRQKMGKRKHEALATLIHPPSTDPQFPLYEDGTVIDSFDLKVIFERYKTGFEEYKEFQISLGMCIAGRYIVESQLGQAAFSKALRCYDQYTKTHVCMKVIRNDKDYVDQSLDEIKLLRYINCNADVDMVYCLRLLDFFYYKEHLILVTEMLKENLYEFGRKYREKKETYFTMGRLQRIAFQVLQALEYIHSLQLIHSDLKPENILIKAADTCEVQRRRWPSLHAAGAAF